MQRKGKGKKQSVNDGGGEEEREARSTLGVGKVVGAVTGQEAAKNQVNEVNVVVTSELSCNEAFSIRRKRETFSIMSH